MAARKILQLGNPTLYKISTPVEEFELPAMQKVIVDLRDTMMNFRAKYEVGRAIAAPQIGVAKRLIYMFIEEPVVFINPEIKDKSDTMMILWDDCMSFPQLLVKVQRHQSCRITFRNENWQECEMALTGDLSELLQHEYDHLDGILAVSRAIDTRSFAFASERKFLG